MLGVLNFSKGGFVAHNNSARKRIRQESRRRARNRAYISSLRSAVKKLRLSIEKRKAGEVSAEELQKIFSRTQSLLMKSVSKGRIKKNNASRRIKRFAHHVKCANQSSS